MKKDIHPKYQQVLFVDSATNVKFLCGTTLQPGETEVFEGQEYPVYRVPISAASHPFFTGSKQFLDTEGRVDKFRKRYAAKAPVSQDKQESEQEQEQPKPEQPKKGKGKATPKK